MKRISKSGNPKIKMRKTADDYLINAIVYTVLSVSVIAMLYPFLNIIAVAFSSYKQYVLHPLMIFPSEITINAFTYVFGSKMLISSYANSIFVTVVGTLISLTLTILVSYSVSKKHLRGKGIIMSLLLFTMMFSGGLIPHFLLMKNLKLVDKLWALIVPYLLSPFNVVLMRNYFSNMPESLEEAARIDGASEIYVLTRIVVPLAMPIIATIALFVAVGYWNNYFAAVVYIRSLEKWPLQLLLREILLAASNQMLGADGNLAEMSGDAIPMVSIRYATIIVVMLPILCVYPPLQKYFVKGVMLGAVKG